MVSAIDNGLDEDKENYGKFANIIESGLQELLDAHTAADFGVIYDQHYPGVKLRLCSPPLPDFQLQIGNNMMWFEVTEANRPGRTRGAEYRAFRQSPGEGLSVTHVDDEELKGDSDYTKAVLQERVADKAEKIRRSGYSTESGEKIIPHLILRDNLYHDHTPQACAEFVSEWKFDFPSIWLLPKDGRIVKLWPKFLELKSKDCLLSQYPKKAPKPNWNW